MQLGNGCLICASQQNSCCCFKKEDIMPKNRCTPKSIQQNNPAKTSKNIGPPLGKNYHNVFSGTKTKIIS